MNMERRLDWIPSFDERNKLYGIRGTFGSVPVERKAKFWKEGTVLDQGREGACVGFGWLAELIAQPYTPDEQPTQEFGNKLAKLFYKEAQKIDEWPGDDYSGTSVLAGAKIMKQYGYIDEYRWCFDIDDIIDAVVSQGPVVIGIPWYSGMYRTNSLGLTGPTGDNVGGHCITLTGYHPAKIFGRQSLEVFKWRNSWGEDYGVNGSGYIRVSDLRNLFEEGGEACIPVVRNKPVLTYPPRSVNKVSFWVMFVKKIIDWFMYRFTLPKAVRNK
ncbi:hypothetical protein N9H78_04335 [Winogradskyella sp.]|nr:C1 family peptidase [Winogradskyella sp.]MDA8874870.1 hypothetical protein [Winogradskyella sp.]